MKIMIIRPGALGDTVVCIPLLKVLCSHHKVSFLGREPGIYFVKKVISDVHDIETGLWHNIFANQEHSKVNFTQDHDTVIAFFRSDLEIIKKNLTRIFKNAKISIYPSFPTPGKKIHILKYLSEIIETAGLRIRKSDLKEVVRKGIFNGTPMNGKKIVYHIGSGSPKKNFKIELWMHIKHVIAKYFQDRQHIFLFGPAEEKEFFEYSNVLKDEKIQPLFLDQAQELERVLRMAFLYLGHDSGPTHLAALMGIPTIAFFKTSPLKIWRPVGRFVKVLKGTNEKMILTLLEQVIKRVKDS